jgi:hypothetical protein
VHLLGHVDGVEARSLVDLRLVDLEVRHPVRRRREHLQRPVDGHEHGRRVGRQGTGDSGQQRGQRAGDVEIRPDECRVCPGEDF